MHNAILKKRITLFQGPSSTLWPLMQINFPFMTHALTVNTFPKAIMFQNLRSCKNSQNSLRLFKQSEDLCVTECFVKYENLKI